MQQLYIIGAGGHAKVIYDAINEAEYPNVLFLIQDEFLANPDQNQWTSKVESFEKTNGKLEQKFICAIGKISARHKLYDIAESRNWQAQTILHPSAIVSKNSAVGVGTYIGAMAVVNPGSSIAKNCIVNTGAIIEHDCTIGPHVNVSPAATVCGSVKISERTYIGAGATILPGVTIGDNCIIGAGAVVTTNVKPATTVIGVPACPT